MNHVPSRRDFFRDLTRTTLAGASILEFAHYRAAWARAMVPQSDSKLFQIQKVSDNVYFAYAAPQAMVNCNAAIFVNATDLLIVDSHSKPSASAALLAQIRKEITTKPVRYLVNTHFHWDHTQGNHTYRTAAAGGPVDFIASQATKTLMSDLAEKRLKESLDSVAPQIDSLQSRAAKSTSPAEKEWCTNQIAQLKAYREELSHYHLELPTITFENSYVVKEKPHDIHVEFHGRAHTRGDVVVFCPQDRVVATGDMILGTMPFIADGFPRAWPATIASVKKLDFSDAMPGHGPVQRGKGPMTNLANYIEELTEAVVAGKQAGKSVTELQGELTLDSLKSIRSNDYGAYLLANINYLHPAFNRTTSLRNAVKTNVSDIYKNIDRT
jgi:cyclase